MSVLASIFNCNEQLVLDELARQTKELTFTDEQLSDMACLALNKVPAKYIKHSVDRVFYMDEGECAELDKLVKSSVTEALEFVRDSEEDEEGHANNRFGRGS